MSDRDDGLLKATLAELGWTTTFSTPSSLACEALRTLHTALERRKVEAKAAQDEIWKYKNALRDALDLAARAVEDLDDANRSGDWTDEVAKYTARIGELMKVLDER